MADPVPLGLSSSAPLDVRLRAMLRELPREHAGLIEALLQERDLLVGVAERRAERMQRLLEASASLLRTLDRDEIEAEVCRQLLRLIPSDGVVVVRAGAGGESPEIVLHESIHGPAPVDAAPWVDSAIQESVRTGRPSRVPLPDGVVAMAIPVMQGFRLIGLLGAYARYGGAFTDEDIEAAQTLAAQAATAMMNAALYTQAEREKRQSDALASLARALGAAQRPQEVLRLALRHALSLFGVEGASISIKRDDFLFITAADGSARALQGMAIPIQASVSGRALNDRVPIICNDVETDPAVYLPTCRVAGITSFLVAPLLTGGDATGTVNLNNRARPFEADDARMLQQFAAQVSVAIANARLYEEAAEAQREITAAFEAVGGGLVVLDPDGRVLRCNRRFYEVSGFAEADGAVGRDFYGVVLDDPRELSEECVIGQAVLGGRLARSQLRSVWNGHVLDVVAAPHPAGGAVVSVDDVTEFLTLAERHRLVVETTTDAILITTVEGQVEFANPAARALLGGGEALVGRELSDLLAAGEPAAWTEALTTARGGTATQLRTEVGPLTARRLASASLAPMRDENRVTHFVVSLRDITEETTARDEMAAANARYRDLVELATDAIVTLDVRGMFTSINPAMEALTGYPAPAILGHTFSAFLEPSETVPVEADFKRVIGGESRRTELHIAHPTLGRRLVSIALTPMRRAGVVVGVLAIARDVTEERAQAEALSRAEARYSRLVEAAEDAIACVDEEGTLTAVNRALENVTGVPREQLLGRHFMDFIDTAERPAMWRNFAAALAGERSRQTIRFNRRDGVRGYSTVVAAPITEGGRVTGVLAIARDVTDEQLLLEQAVRQDKMVAMGELVGGVAHEVNSPLTSILAYAQVLERGTTGTTLGDDALRAVETIAKEAQRAARIVSKLLAFARQGVSERVPSDLNQVLRDTLDLRRYALKVQEVRLQVSLMSEPPLVESDPFQLQQVFINLLANAEQAVAHQPGPREIRVSSQVRDGAFVVIVSDNGPGIAPEALPHIFNPFFTTKPRGAGTGLGLSISEGIVREHRGFLRVRSEPGEGATFEVEIPLSSSKT